MGARPALLGVGLWTMPASGSYRRNCFIDRVTPPGLVGSGWCEHLAGAKDCGSPVLRRDPQSPTRATQQTIHLEAKGFIVTSAERYGQGQRPHATGVVAAGEAAGDENESSHRSGQAHHERERASALSGAVHLVDGGAAAVGCRRSVRACGAVVIRTDNLHKLQVGAAVRFEHEARRRSLIGIAPGDRFTTRAGRVR